MLRTMVFIDYLNFDIALKDLFTKYKEPFPRLDYAKLAAKLTKEIPNSILTKTYLCYPEPDDFLKGDTYWAGFERSMSGWQNVPFLDVIKGRYVSRDAPGAKRDIADPLSYVKQEKGTDINIATHMLTKAFNNSLDAVILLSADTDYSSTLEVLRTIGKLSLVAVMDGQTSKLCSIADKQYIMKKEYFKDCLR